MNVRNLLQQRGDDKIFCVEKKNEEFHFLILIFLQTDILR